MRPSIGRNPRRLTLALLGTLAVAVLSRVRRRRPAPVMHGLVLADEERFVELCQQITGTRRGGKQ